MQHIVDIKRSAMVPRSLCSFRSLRISEIIGRVSNTRSPFSSVRIKSAGIGKPVKGFRIFTGRFHRRQGFCQSSAFSLIRNFRSLQKKSTYSVKEASSAAGREEKTPDSAESGAYGIFPVEEERRRNLPSRCRRQGPERSVRSRGPPGLLREGGPDRMEPLRRKFPKSPSRNSPPQMVPSVPRPVPSQTIPKQGPFNPLSAIQDAM